MTAASDPNLAHLQGFCDLLERTGVELRASSAALQERSEALHGPEGQAAPAPSGPADIGSDDAAAGLAALARAAGERLTAEPEPASDALASAGADLEAAGERVLAEGYEPLESTAQELEQDAERQSRDVEAAARTLVEKLQALRAEATQEAASVRDAVGQARGRVERRAAELTARGEGAVEAVARELAELKQGCGDIATDLADFYREWGTASEDEADSLLRGVAEAGEEACDLVATDGAMRLEGAAREALGEPLARLRAALDEADAAITAVATAAWELEGLVPQLAICMNVVENINRLLEEMG
ncbi:MAG TPA: hypothetical protein VF310_01110 [Vicinamibacteria bacterium]